MKKEILILSLLSIGLVPMIWAQMTIVELKTKYSALGYTPPATRNPNTVLDMRFRGTKGTPYIQKDWAPGTVYLKSGMKKEHVLINYDVVEDKPIIRGELGDDIHIAPLIVDRFVMEGNMNREFRQFPNPRKKGEFMFLEVLEEGKATLMIRRRRYFVPADYSNSAYNAQLHAEYKPQPDQFYVLREGDPKLHRLKDRRGKCLKFFKDNYQAMKDYMNVNEIYGKIEHQELLEAVRFYNALP